jgi:hypothetical protein
VPDLPKEDLALGILPKLIATLVNRRREVKKLMKDPRATPDELALWDTKQMALKLTANSMYGCLGYTQSRFYARPLAMLTTFKGREILRSTKELAESNQLQVVYGDTDSVMINTNANNIAEAFKIGKEFKRSVNDRYKLLEIDIDNVFRKLLLHAKKKYAAMNVVEVDGKYVDKLEIKGLDMKRREYCALSKEASSTILNIAFSGEDMEVVLENIHEYLRELSNKMREEQVPVQKYVIYTVRYLLLHITPQTNSSLETRQKPQRIPQRGLNAPSPSRPPRTLSWQDHPQGGRNVLHRNGRLQNLLRTRRKARLHPPGRPETRLRPQTRHRVLPPQADLPSHRTSLRAYPRHRLRSSGRMLRP